LSPFYKNLALWLIIILMVILSLNYIKDTKRESHDINYSEFLAALKKGEIAEVEIKGNKILGKYNENSGSKMATRFQTFGITEKEELLKILQGQGVNFSVKPDEPAAIWPFLTNWLPIILFLGLFIFFMRQIQSGGGKAMSFGKARAKLMSESQQKVTFEDVAGIDEAKLELEEIIAFLKEPKKFTKLGGRIPKGVLLMGAPGTGKTLLARAIAGEAGVPFFSISGSDFVEMFVGVGASRVRDLFIQGKKHAPCIIFIDELDAVGRHRGAGLGGGHDEREQTLNQLLVEMDGFESNEGVILISATNRPDVLDPALLRPGRFDRRVVVPRPDVKGREGILAVHTRKTPLAPNVDLKVLARGTPGFSGADLESLVNEAALLAARFDKEMLEMSDFEAAKDKVLMGSERKSMIISENEKRNTAYHEAGHALVAAMLPGTDPIHKVSIIPRGMALGLTQQLPMSERHTHTRTYLLNDLTILMGGRAAEMLIFNECSTGASNDIERCTELTRKMVCEWGMSEKMGPISLGKKEEQIFLGKEISRHQDYSESTAIEIDQEIHRIVTDSYRRAEILLRENRDILVKIAETLLDKEVLDGSEVCQMVSRDGFSQLPIENQASQADLAGTSTGSNATKAENDSPVSLVKPPPLPGANSDSSTGSSIPPISA
jgi:cell division protease FtsH